MFTYIFSVTIYGTFYERTDKGTVMASNPTEAEERVHAHYRPQYDEDARIDVLIHTAITFTMVSETAPAS